MRDAETMRQLLEGNAEVLAEIKAQNAEMFAFIKLQQASADAAPPSSPAASAVAAVDRWQIDSKKIKLKMEQDEDGEEGEMVKVELGSGSFGTVYLGTHDHSPVAVKEMKITSDADIAAFKKEVGLMFRLYHPNIVACPGGSILKKSVRMVTELMETSLGKEIHTQQISFTEPQRRKVIVHVARGLSYLHAKGVTHRDLKPDNVMRDAFGQWKLIDFGMASTKSSSQKSTKKTGANQGTQGYMAPELYTPAGGSRKVDAFAFGITIWELYARVSPFTGVGDLAIGRIVEAGERPPLASAEPKDVQELIAACWHQNPEQRPEMQDVVGIIETDRNAELAKYRKRLSVYLKDGVLDADEREALDKDFSDLGIASDDLDGMVANTLASQHLLEEAERLKNLAEEMERRRKQHVR
jgi:serine/threonine protein kinase